MISKVIAVQDSNAEGNLVTDLIRLLYGIL